MKRGMIVLVMLVSILGTANSTNFTNTTVTDTGGTFFVKPEECIYNPDSTNYYCALYRTLNLTVELDYSENYTDENVNLTVFAPELGTCPACPTTGVCTFNRTFHPKLRLTNYTYFEISNADCDLEISISGCEVPIRYDIPEGYHLISENDWASISTCINDSRICNVEKSAIEFQRSQCQLELVGMRDLVCPVNLTQLYYGGRVLNQFSSQHLPRFSTINYPVTIFEFSEIVVPEASGNSRASADYWSNIAMEQYVRAGFAETVTIIREEVNERTGEVIQKTILKYKPIITPNCVEIIDETNQLYGDGMGEGIRNVTIFFIILVVIIIVSLIIASRVPFVPAR